MQRLSDGKLLQARELRKKMTEAETVLWQVLRRKNFLGIKFRRQQVIEGFITDFYCEKARLVIEIDGEGHSTPEQKAVDAHRRDVFVARGLREIRFSNSEIFSDIQGVLKKVKSAVGEK